MSRKVAIEVSAKDKTKAAFNSALHNLANFVHVARGAIDVMKVFGKALTAGIKTAMGWEAAAKPFARFVGSVEEAQGHVRALQDIGARGVIPGDQLVEASRQLMQLSDGLLGGVGDMKALADAAATTGNDIGKVSASVGNFIQRLKAGDDVTRAVRDLEAMGVVSGDAAAKMRHLAKDADNAGDVFDLLTAEVNKFQGGLEDDMTTAAATVNRVKDQWRMALGEAGTAFLDVGKGPLANLANRIQDLRDSGVVEEWAQRTVDALENYVKPAFDIVAKAIGAVIEGIRRAIDFVKSFNEARRGGAGVFEAAGMAGAQNRQVADARRMERERQKAIRQERIRAAREARAEEEGVGFAATGLLRESISGQAADEQAAEETASVSRDAKRSLSDFTRSAMDSLRRMGHDVEEFVAPGTMARERQEARRAIEQNDRQVDLLEQSVKTEEQIRDLLEENLRAK